MYIYLTHNLTFEMIYDVLYQIYIYLVAPTNEIYLLQSSHEDMQITMQRDMTSLSYVHSVE